MFCPHRYQPCRHTQQEFTCQVHFSKCNLSGDHFLRLLRVNRVLTAIKIFLGTIIIYRSVRIFIIGYDVCDRIFTVIQFAFEHSSVVVARVCGHIFECIQGIRRQPVNNEITKYNSTKNTMLTCLGGVIWCQGVADRGGAVSIIASKVECRGIAS